MAKKGKAPASTGASTRLQFGLGGLRIGLWSNTPHVTKYAYQFLEDWESLVRGPESAENYDIQIHLALAEALPDLPVGEPVFIGERTRLPDGVGALHVYETPGGPVLYFQDGGLVQLGDVDGRQPVIRGEVTGRLLQHGRLHDLLFTSLSPFLRRRNYYLVHASAAVPRGGNGAALFVGAAGSGKTTIALNLALNDWDVLSNDTLLLEERPGGIYALPTPGGFSIRPKSITFIPALARYTHKLSAGKLFHYSLHKFGLKYAEPVPITHIYFPEIVEGHENDHLPISPVAALGRLITYSLDRWDTAVLPTHVAFLAQLTRQSQAALLKIASQQQIPELLMKNS